MNGSMLSYDFMVNAFLSIIFGSITAGIIGTYIVSRRIIFITGGITHASFGGLGFGYFVGINPLIGAAIFAVLAGFGVEKLSARRKIREDSLIAMAWSMGMAIGVIFIYLTPGYAPNLMSYLFGNILSVSSGDLWIMLTLMVVVLVIFFLLYRPIQFVTFDEEFARTSGLPVTFIKYLMIGLVALTSVLYIRVAGIILVLSILTVPQNTAMLLTHKMRPIMILSIIFSLIGSFAGLMISWYWNIPSGASIIFSLVFLYFVVYSIKRIFFSAVKY